MTKEELTKKVREAVDYVITESTENYIKGKDRAAYKTIDYSVGNGRFMIVKFPDDHSIYANYTHGSAPYGDIGNDFGSVSTMYFSIESVVNILVEIITKAYEE